MAIAGDRLIAIAYRILRDLDRAEDAVQVALVSAWRDLPTLREPDRFEAWLTRILVRAPGPVAGPGGPPSAGGPVMGGPGEPAAGPPACGSFRSIRLRHPIR